MNRETILKAIRELANGDSPPTLSEYEQHGPTSSGPVYNYFDSWNEAVKEAECEPNQRTSIGREEILGAIRELADGDTPPTSDDYEQDGPTVLHMIYDHFDSWNEAVDKAGFEPHERHNVPREAILASVQKLAESLSRPPLASEFDNRGITSPYAAKKHCDGTWKSVIEEAGFDYSKVRIPRENLLEEIHRLADEHGQAPTQVQTNDGNYSVSTYQDRWGTYNNALEVAGYEPRASKMTEEEVLNRLREVASELGHTPRIEEIDDTPRISRWPVLDKFGSWWAGLVRAGLRPQKPQPLQPEAFLRLHEAAVSELDSNPAWALTTLLFQFTGLTPDAVATLSEDWIQELADEHIISIPRKYTKTDSRWEFRLPETWHSVYDDEERPTRLPTLLTWYFDGHDSLFTPGSAHRILCRIAARADLSDFREVHDERYRVEDAPQVRPFDLRVTHGLQLARNGAPSELICRRLGLDAVGSNIDIQELFIWLDEREDYQHPEYKCEYTE